MIAFVIFGYRIIPRFSSIAAYEYSCVVVCKVPDSIHTSFLKFLITKF